MAADAIGAAAGTSTAALPAHAVDDHIFLFVANNSASVPPVKPDPGGTVPLFQEVAVSAGNSTSMICVYARATATNHTVGTWTGAVRMAAVVVRGADLDWPVGGVSKRTGAVSGVNTAIATVDAVTLDQTDGTSQIISVVYGNNWGSGTVSGAPSGYTRETASTSTSTGIILNSKNVTTSDGSYTQQFSSTWPSTNYNTMQIEIPAVSNRAAPVLFDAIGDGKAAATSGTTPSNGSWSHTCSGNDRAVIVHVAVSRNGSGATSTITRSATYGGIAMTELAAGSLGGGSISSHMITWGLLNPPTGAQTVQVNITQSAGGSGFAGNSVSYTNVDSFDTAQMVAGAASGTAMAQGVTGSAVGDMISQAFSAANASGVGISSYTPTPPRFFVTTAAWSKAISAGDSPGAAGTVNFSAVRGSAVAWRGHAIILRQKIALPPEADAGTGNYTWAGAATGSTPRKGTGSGAYGWAGAATGKTVRKGTGSGAYGWAGAATGRAQRSASSSGNYLWTGSATGSALPKASAGTGNYTFITLGAGDVDYTGYANGSYTFAGSAEGTTPSGGTTARGNYGWASLTVGKSLRSAVAAGAYTWAGAATGLRNSKALAGLTSYGWVSSTPTGKRVPKAAVLATGYTFEASDPEGHRTGAGVASGAYHFTGIGTGLFVPRPVDGVVGWYAE